MRSPLQPPPKRFIIKYKIKKKSETAAQLARVESASAEAAPLETGWGSQESRERGEAGGQFLQDLWVRAFLIRVSLFHYCYYYILYCGWVWVRMWTHRTTDSCGQRTGTRCPVLAQY